MVIVHIITALGYGGAEKLLATLLHQAPAGQTVHIIYLKKQTDMMPQFPPGVQFHYVPLSLFSTASQINALLKVLKPDVVHTHLGHADLLGLWAARNLPAKLFCTMHNIQFKHSVLDWFIFFMYWLLFKTVAKRCHVVCISKSVQHHVQRVLGVNPSQVHLLYNGIPKDVPVIPKAEARKLLGLPPRAPIVLFVGRLEKQKNVSSLIAATELLKAAIPGVHVAIIGEGSLEMDLKMQVQSLGLQSSVVFYGTQPNIHVWYAAADVFALPSLFEGMGIVIIEAFRAGLPVVASNVQGPAELILNGDNGFLFPVNNHKALANALIAILTDKQLAGDMSLAAFGSFTPQFYIENYSANLYDLYQQS